MVGDKAVEGDIGHVSVGFQFGENVFLRTASVVKFDDLSGAGCFIGEDNLVGKAKLQRDEEVKLDWFLRLNGLFCSDEEESERTVPGFRLPRFLKEGGIGCAGSPTLA